MDERRPDTRPRDGRAYSIRDLARLYEVTARTLRFYESRGLLHPHREGTRRLYSETDRARLELILRGKRVGFSLDDIAEMLDVEMAPGRSPEALARTEARFARRIEALRAQRQDIDLAIRDLEAGRAWLSARRQGMEPSQELRQRAAAFERLANNWLYDGEVPAASRG